MFASRRCGIHNFSRQFLDFRKVSYSYNRCHHIQNKVTLLVILNKTAGEYWISKAFSKSDFGLLRFVQSA